MTDEAIPQERRYARISLPKGMQVAWHGGDLQLFSRGRTRYSRADYGLEVEHLVGIGRRAKCRLGTANNVHAASVGIDSSLLPGRCHLCVGRASGESVVLRTIGSQFSGPLRVTL